MSSVSPAETTAADIFHHQAVFYRGLDDFVDTIAPFLRGGVEAGEPVMVVALADRLRALRAALGPYAGGVQFADMAEVGRNPARIIPAWRHFVERIPRGSPARAVGEPVWAGRRAVELEECRLHESLLNLAFDAGRGWQLLCPYDMDALPDTVTEDAMRTHPWLSGSQGRRVSYGGASDARSTFAAALPPPPRAAEEFAFGRGDLGQLRRFVRRLADQAGLPEDVADDVVLAAHELASNSIQHGDGWGQLRSWTEPGAFVVEVRDTGVISDPLVGRELSDGFAESGRGVWMANQLCDLVQVRSTPLETAVRLFAWL